MNLRSWTWLCFQRSVIAGVKLIFLISCVFASECTAGGPAVEDCRKTLQELHTFFLGRTIQYESEGEASFSNSRLEFEQVERLPRAFKEISHGEVTKWQTNYAFRAWDPNQPSDYFGAARLKDRNLQIVVRDSKIDVVMLAGQPFSDASSSALCGIFAVPGGDRYFPRFEEWAVFKDWDINQGGNLTVFLAQLDDETVRLTFSALPKARLDRIELRGECANVDKGFEETKINYKIRCELGYTGSAKSELGNRFEFPQSADLFIHKMGVEIPELKSPAISGYYARKTRLLGLSEVKKTPTRWNDIVKNVPNGTRIPIFDHRGIEFEWRDGDIVRVIDRKKLDDINGLHFRGSKWTIPIAVCIVACLGATGFWWFRR